MRNRVTGKKIGGIFFFLLILLTPTQLGRHWWPDWSLVNGIRIDYLSPTLYITDIVVIFLTITALRRQWTKSRTCLFKISLLLRIVYCVLFIASSPRPFLSLYWIVRYLQIPFIAYLTVAFAKRAMSLLRPALSIGVFFSILLGVGQMVFGKTTGLFWVFGERTFTVATSGISTITLLGKTVLRPYATFPHPNAFAGYLALSFFLLKKKISRCVALFGVVLSASRTALLSVLLALLLPSLFLSSAKDGLSQFSLIVFPQTSRQDRTVLNNAAWRMFLDHPFFGVGSGHFLVELPHYLPPRNWLLQPVHNVLLLLLAEFGIVGISIGLLSLVGLIRRIKFQKTWMPILIVLFTTGFFDHYWITAQQNRILLGVTFGVLLSTREKSLLQ